jgi:hypothetical protein
MVYGINLSMSFQHTMIETGLMILERNLAKQLKKFRFVILPNSGSAVAHASSIDKDYSIFGRSASHLSRLAAFIHSANKICGQINLPIVIAALNEDNDTYLVVGSFSKTTGGLVKKK